MEYRAYTEFKEAKSQKRKNRIRLNFIGGSCDIINYSHLHKIIYDGEDTIHLIYSDGIYQISGHNLKGLVECLQFETVEAINAISESEAVVDDKPVVLTIEHLSHTEDLEKS